MNLPGVGGDDYEKELARWTRKLEVYRRFEAKVFVTATYHAPAFREAYIRKRTALLGLPQHEHQALADDQHRRGEQCQEFFVALTTGEVRWNDLERQNSIWRLTLVNDRQERVAPTKIERVDPQDAEITSYYPFIDAFSQGYLVCFPHKSLELNTPMIDNSVHSFILQLSSPVAVASLTWE